MNNHVTACRHGTSSDRFDNHVFECKKNNNYETEPLFQIYAFMTVPHENMLLPYERYLHSKSFDTMN